MLAERGVFVDHSTLHRWSIKMLPVLEATFRRRKRPVGLSWRMDEPYFKVGGEWKYLHHPFRALRAMRMSVGDAETLSLNKEPLGSSHECLPLRQRQSQHVSDEFPVNGCLSDRRSLR